MLLESHYRVALLIEHATGSGEEPPAGLWNKVMNEIAQEAPGTEKNPFPARDWRPGMAVAAAGLAVGVLLGQYAGTFSSAASSISAPYTANLPMAVPTIGSYIQQHNRLASQDPLADHISLAAYVTAAYRDNAKFQETAQTHR
jgi:hypothetical protein